MKNKAVRIEEIVKIAPKLKVNELIDIFRLFGIELNFKLVKKKGKK